MCKKYDVAIIGGGVIGSSVAHFLAERGHKVKDCREATDCI